MLYGNDEIAYVLNETNIIGLDNGAGEHAAQESVKIGNVIKTSERLSLTNTSDKKDYSVYYKMPSGRDVVGLEASSFAKQNDPYGIVYVNFKRPPTGDYASQRYERYLDQNVLTYEEVMRLHFQTIIKNIFANNPKLNDVGFKKHTLIFVGRPSGQAWEDAEQQYARLLKKDLHIPGYTDKGGTVDVIIYSEALAALASEYHNGNISGNQVFIIIDGGSSTFDAVIVKDGAPLIKYDINKSGQTVKKTAEYSRQIGGGMIDENMLDIFIMENDEDLYSSCQKRAAIRSEKYMRLTDYSPGLHKLELRQKKEMYFGKNGIDGDHYNLVDTVYINNVGIQKFITDDFMNKALTQMPVFVKGSYSGDGTSYDDVEFPSFRAAVEDFFRGVALMCADFNIRPDKVILTGGVTVIPFIREFALNMFGVEPVRTKFPNFSVAEGLAFMGCAELIKNEEFLKLRQSKNALVDSLQSEMIAIVNNALFDSFWKLRFDHELKIWISNPFEVKTMKDWYKKADVVIPFEEIAININAKISASGLLDKLNQNIRKNFAALLPSVNEDCKFQIDSHYIRKSFAGQPPITIDGDLLTYLGFLNMISKWIKAMFKGVDPWDLEYDYESRRKLAEQIRSRKDVIRRDFNEKLHATDIEICEKIIEILKLKLEEELIRYVDGLTPYLARFAH